jgi:hypothetical protein
MLNGLAAAARQHAGGAMPNELLDKVDAALAHAVQEPAGKAREDALIGITGIRRGLFPHATACSGGPFNQPSNQRRLVA